MFNKLSFHIWVVNLDLSGGGYTTASEVRGLQLDGLGVLFSAHFCSMPRKLAGCFVEDISHQRLPVQVLVFVFCPNWFCGSGWDASITQKTKRSFVEGSENPSPRLTVFECNSWSWKLVKLRIVIIIICTLPRARSPLHFRVILVSIGTNDHTDLPCFCQRSGELSMGMKKRKSNYSLQNQFESLRTDGVVRCIRQKRVFDEERREIKLDHTCRYRISFLKYLRPNLFGSDIPRRKNTCILCSITVIFINLLV